jgi:hypothetical protein
MTGFENLGIWRFGREGGRARKGDGREGYRGGDLRVFGGVGLSQPYCIVTLVESGGLWSIECE